MNFKEVRSFVIENIPMGRQATLSCIFLSVNFTAHISEKTFMWMNLIFEFKANLIPCKGT